MAPNPAPPEPSALTQLISSASASNHPIAATTLQILHNLQYQHLWTSLQTHDIPIPLKSTTDTPPMSLISGIPPHRVYTHPDEQLYMLEKGLRDDDLRPERLFVIPTAQGQSWSVHRIAAVFDSLPEIPSSDHTESSMADVDAETQAKLTEYYTKKEAARATREWGGKRILLAMVDKGMGGDGTVAYYVVHDGEVKPRQN
ncbi:uncharacterized protein PFLUO_LOCUS1541 [Penicillium psychrofluorescens]|uniref:uncharacterized protein n=1 Tax=Penicillium psychrofluorescens TaxID=3158075 RepID=UPI003CCCB3EA